MRLFYSTNNQLYDYFLSEDSVLAIVGIVTPPIAELGPSCHENTPVPIQVYQAKQSRHWWKCALNHFKFNLIVPTKCKHKTTYRIIMQWDSVTLKTQVETCSFSSLTDALTLRVVLLRSMSKLIYFVDYNDGKVRLLAKKAVCRDSKSTTKCKSLSATTKRCKQSYLCADLQWAFHTPRSPCPKQKSRLTTCVSVFTFP